MTEDELLDLIDKLDGKIDEIDDQIAELQAVIVNYDADKREPVARQILLLQRERRRIDEIINGHMKTLKDLK
jgi:peptidoglycan hydrolase CwlO-like protein